MTNAAWNKGGFLCRAYPLGPSLTLSVGMIATGGLLRIHARRQDSLPPKPRNPKTHKRKKRRCNEVVVVKGKLHLCSVSGLLAALGILVLLVGMAMSILGYWYRDDLYISISAPGIATLTAAMPQDEIEGGEKGGESVEMDGGRGGNVLVNRTQYVDRPRSVNGTEQTQPEGFFQDLINRYLNSHRMKMIGPLIMGVGIFLFICANAILHENRDKKTKVISLRDIYSTAVDLHSLQKPPAEPRSPANPLNHGLANHVHPPTLLAKKGGGSGEEEEEEEVRNDQEERNTVFSIYQEEPLAAPPSSHMHSWSSFTLPTTGTSASRPAQPRRLSTGASTQLRRLSTGTSNQPRRLSTGASTQLRRLSTGASTQLRRLSTGASTQPRRLSTGASTQPRRLSTGASTQLRRLSTGASTQPSPL